MSTIKLIGTIPSDCKTLMFRHGDEEGSPTLSDLRHCIRKDPFGGWSPHRAIDGQLYWWNSHLRVVTPSYVRSEAVRNVLFQALDTIRDVNQGHEVYLQVLPGDPTIVLYYLVDEEEKLVDWMAHDRANIASPPRGVRAQETYDVDARRIEYWSHVEASPYPRDDGKILYDRLVHTLRQTIVAEIPGEPLVAMAPFTASECAVMLQMLLGLSGKNALSPESQPYRTATIARVWHKISLAHFIEVHGVPYSPGHREANLSLGPTIRQRGFINDYIPGSDPWILLGAVLAFILMAVAVSAGLAASATLPQTNLAKQHSMNFTTQAAPSRFNDRLALQALE